MKMRCGLLLIVTGCAGGASIPAQPIEAPPAPSVSASASPEADAGAPPAKPESTTIAEPAAPPWPPPPARVLWAVEPVDNTGSYKIQVVSGAGIVMVGHNRTFVSSPDDMFIEALGEDGSARWYKSGTAKWVRAVSGTAEHSFFASEFTGKLAFEGAQAHDANSAGFVAKVSAAGALEWGRALGSGSFTRVSSIAATSDGGVAVAVGIFAAAKTGPLALPVAGGQDAVIVRYDGAGQVAWTRAFRWRGYDEAIGVLADAEGDLVTGGTRWKSPDTWASELAGGRCHGWVARLGANGEPRWVIDLGADTTRVTIERMALAPKGAVVVAGKLLGRHRLGSAELEARDKERGYLAKVDRDGKVVWARLHDVPDCLAVDAADRLVIAGPKGISIETDAGEAQTVLPFAAEAVTGITDCRLDGAKDLYIGGAAQPGASVGDKPLRGAVMKRQRTSWLKPYEVAFVAKIAW